MIVENSGEATQVEELCSKFAGLDTAFVDPGGNVGYARGVNIAAERLSLAGCTYLLVLNPDVELTASPEVLLPYLDEVDVVSGVLAPSGADAIPVDGKIVAPNCVRPVTWASSVVGALVGSRFASIGKVDSAVLSRVPQVAGAYMLQSMDSYLADPLDEAFELYFEDVEHCERAHGGRGVGVVGLQVGRHAAGSSYRASGGIGYTVNRVSQARYLRRKYPRFTVVLLSVPFLLEWAVRSVTWQSRRNGRSYLCLPLGAEGAAAPPQCSCPRRQLYGVASRHPREGGRAFTCTDAVYSGGGVT